MRLLDRVSSMLSLLCRSINRGDEIALDRKPGTVCLLLPLGLFLFSGCATMSKDECLVGNWYDVGYRDGIAGYTAARIVDHQKACAAYGVAPEPNAYYQGRDAGLQVYCDLYHAVDEGLAGRLYRGVCPDNIDAAYRQLNDAAYRIYNLRNDIRNKTHEIDSLEWERYQDKTSEHRRREIRHEIHRLERELDWLLNKLNWQELDLDRLTDEILHRYAPAG